MLFMSVELVLSFESIFICRRGAVAAANGYGYSEVIEKYQLSAHLLLSVFWWLLCGVNLAKAKCCRITSFSIQRLVNLFPECQNKAAISTATT